jgi:DNA-binding NarL/FixJ family response regulator
MAELKVLLVDNKELFREGLARILESQSHICVVYQCDNGSKAVEKAQESEPDVVLMDADLPQCDGIEATRRINESLPNTRLAMLTDSEDEEKLFTALQAGATGYLLKSIRVDDLVKSIDLIAEGEVIVSHPLSEKLLSEFASMREQKVARESESETGVSDRETEILTLVVQGATNKEIAKTLVIAENTVKVHVKNILEKLQLRNKQQLAAYAVEKGLVSETEGTAEKLE